MGIEDRISALIAPTLEALGYELVRVQHQNGPRQGLQIMAERCDRRAMNVDDCAELSRALSAVLDVEDPIPGEYTLEVSSPGLDRPLTRPQDYERFAGYEVSVATRHPVEGRKRFRGRLLGISADRNIRLAAEAGELLVPLDAIDRAKLVLTDELMAASLKKQDQE